MTHKTSISVDISHLSEGTRRRLPKQLDLPTRHSTARASKVCVGPRTSISLDLNVRDATGCKNVEYGASVFAAGRVGLELARIALARAGVARDEIDGLNTRHVSIQKATIPYVFTFTSRAETAIASAALNHLALRLGLTIRHCPNTNTVNYRGFLVKGSTSATAQDKPNSDDSQTEASLILLRQPDRKLVLIEVPLQIEYLKKKDWVALDSWRTAYAENRYALIFDEIVRTLLRLDGPVRYSEPSRDVLDKMSYIEEELLRHYMDGKDPITYGRFIMAIGQSKKNRLLNYYRKLQLNRTGIDLKIPWQSFRVIRPLRLSNQLKYPGDFIPPDGQANLYFCKTSWPYHLAELRGDLVSPAC